MTQLDDILDTLPIRPGVHWRIHPLPDLDMVAVIESSRGLGFVVAAYALEREGWRDTLRALAVYLLGEAPQLPNAPRDLDLDGPAQSPPLAPGPNP